VHGVEGEQHRAVELRLADEGCEAILVEPFPLRRIAHGTEPESLHEEPLAERAKAAAQEKPIVAPAEREHVHVAVYLHARIFVRSGTPINAVDDALRQL